MVVPSNVLEADPSMIGSSLRIVQVRIFAHHRCQLNSGIDIANLFVSIVFRRRNPGRSLLMPLWMATWTRCTWKLRRTGRAGWLHRNQVSAVLGCVLGCSRGYVDEFVQTKTQQVRWWITGVCLFAIIFRNKVCRVNSLTSNLSSQMRIPIDETLASQHNWKIDYPHIFQWKLCKD